MAHGPRPAILPDFLPVEYSPVACPSVVFLVMLTSYYFVFSILRTLCRFCASLCTSNPLFSSSYKLFCKTPEWGIPQPRCGSAFPRPRTHFRRRLGPRMSRLFKVIVAASSLCYAVPAKRSGNRRVSSHARGSLPRRSLISAHALSYLRGQRRKHRVVGRQRKRT
jgi:hypothetical protein